MRWLWLMLLFSAAAIAAPKHGAQSQVTPEAQWDIPESNSKPLPKQENASAPHGPQTSETDERGTEQNPVSVKLLNTGKSDKEAAEDANAVREKADLDTWVGTWTIRLTIGLVVATILQFAALLYQSEWLRRSVKVAERALTELERPLVYAEVVDPGFEIRWLENEQMSVLSLRRFELRLFNLGRTPAHITRLEYQLSAAPRGGIVEPIDAQAIGGREMPVGVTVTLERPFNEATNTAAFLSLEQRDEIANFRASAWFGGFVRYDDLVGGHYLTGFAQVYDPMWMRFVIRGDQTYNYSRKEKVREIPAPSANA